MQQQYPIKRNMSENIILIYTPMNLNRARDTWDYDKH